MPDIDDSLDEQSAKTQWWNDFKTLGPWWQSSPPHEDRPRAIAFGRSPRAPRRRLHGGRVAAERLDLAGRRVARVRADPGRVRARVARVSPAGTGRGLLPLGLAFGAAAFGLSEQWARHPRRTTRSSPRSTALAFWFLDLLRERLPGSRSSRSSSRSSTRYSVWRGPTHHIVTQARGGVPALLCSPSRSPASPRGREPRAAGSPVLRPVPGCGRRRAGACGRVLTWAAMTRRRFGTTIAAHRRASAHHRADCPALPARISPSASSPRTRTCSGASCARRTPGGRCAPSARAASPARAGRPSRCAACAGTCPRAVPARAGSPTPPRAP